MSRKFLRPADDELLRVMIEILLVKRRRIHRVEELLDLVHGNLDPMWRALLDFETMNHMGRD